MPGGVLSANAEWVQVCLDRCARVMLIIRVRIDNHHDFTPPREEMGSQTPGRLLRAQLNAA
jgi:hypothetical protein